MKNFVTIFPRSENVHLTKDVGAIPYTFHRHLGYDSTVVSDDNSTDHTLEIVERVLSKSNTAYRIVRNIPAKGVAQNFLAALKLTSGGY